MTYPIDFDDRVQNYLGRLYPAPRSMARVDVMPAAGSAASPWHGMGLIDTGATGLFLPTQIAQRLGYNLSGPAVSQVNVWTAMGFAVMDQRKIDVAIHNVPLIGIDALFFRNQRVLIGRDVLFTFLQAVGFETNHWLLKYTQPQQTAAALPTPVAISRPTTPSAVIEEYETYVVIGGVRLERRKG